MDVVTALASVKVRDAGLGEQVMPVTLVAHFIPVLALTVPVITG
ncbi:hypothetical protein BH10ACT9_BH10ACT9_28290 [soil metagenome]